MCASDALLKIVIKIFSLISFYKIITRSIRENIYTFLADMHRGITKKLMMQNNDEVTQENNFKEFSFFHLNVACKKGLSHNDRCECCNVHEPLCTHPVSWLTYYIRSYVSNGFERYGIAGANATASRPVNEPNRISLIGCFRSKECDVVHGECTQTYVPYLFLVIPLGPVTLTGQDYVLVESGCVCKPRNSASASSDAPPAVPNF